MEDKILISELDEIRNLAIELFEGNISSAEKWLNTPLNTLKNKTPIEYTDSIEHAHIVKSLIKGLEHSVYQ